MRTESPDIRLHKSRETLLARDMEARELWGKPRHFSLLLNTSLAIKPLVASHKYQHLWHDRHENNLTTSNLNPLEATSEDHYTPMSMHPPNIQAATSTKVLLRKTDHSLANPEQPGLVLAQDIIYFRIDLQDQMRHRHRENVVLTAELPEFSSQQYIATSSG